MSDNTDERLQLHVVALENMLEEKKGIADDIKDRKALLKGEGYDVKVVEAILRRRAVERAKVEEFDQLVETYEAALGA
jgi:uncharacterized protein (UPF0335 family)